MNYIIFYKEAIKDLKNGKVTSGIAMTFFILYCMYQSIFVISAISLIPITYGATLISLIVEVVVLINSIRANRNPDGKSSDFLARYSILYVSTKVHFMLLWMLPAITTSLLVGGVIAGTTGFIVLLAIFSIPLLPFRIKVLVDQVAGMSEVAKANPSLTGLFSRQT